MRADEELLEERLRAAQMSGGSSNAFIYRLFLSVIKKHNLNGTAIDFGAGLGALSKELHKLERFQTLTAIDIMPRPPNIPDAIEWISQDLNVPTKLQSNKYDVVISAEVIEHLENPRALIREWYRTLNKNGTLLFSTPNNESWRSILALVFRGHYAAFGESSYPAHITPLLRKDIKRILNETGFQFETFYFTDMGVVPKCIRFTWQKLSCGLLKGLRFSDNILVVAKKHVK